MTIAIISSLYRCEQHLPTFTAAVFGFAKRVSESGIALHFLPLVNDATRAERDQIDRLAGEINSNYYGQMSPHYVSRETLYASWNRGLALTRAEYFAPWNADDIRSADAFIEGCRVLQSGVDLVDFPFTTVRKERRLGVLQREAHKLVPCLFERERFTRGNGLGPFFMASSALYNQLGPFDANFRIAGDTDWASRAIPWVKFHSGTVSGGDFLVHGGNLSNTGSDREDIEVNIIHMRRQNWKQLRPANPKTLRDIWDSWGNSERITLPAEVADFLWGQAAEARWKRYRRERRQPPFLRRLRLALAARGLMPSEEWSMAQRGRD